MRLQIRQSCHETNSSSMHSLVTTKTKGIYSQEEIRSEFFLDRSFKKDKNTLDWLDFDIDYGRNYDVLSTFRDKLSFAVASLAGDCYRLKDYIKAEQWFHDTLEPLLKELVGVDEVKMPTKSNPFYIYEDTIDWDDDEQDVTTYEEVPYADLVYNEERKDGDDIYKDVGKSGRKIERIWIGDLFETGTIDHESVGLLSGFLVKNGLSLKDFLIRKDIVVVIDGDEYCIFGQMVNAGLINMDNIEDVYGRTGGWWIKINGNQTDGKTD